MYILAALSLDEWNPITVLLCSCLGIYALCSGAVMIIRAIRGDNTQTSFESLVKDVINRQGSTLDKLQQQMVPPEAISDVIKGHVLTVAADAKRAAAVAATLNPNARLQQLVMSPTQTPTTAAIPQDVGGGPGA